MVRNYKYHFPQKSLFNKSTLWKHHQVNNTAHLVQIAIAFKKYSLCKLKKFCRYGLRNLTKIQKSVPHSKYSWIILNNLKFSYNSLLVFLRLCKPRTSTATWMGFFQLTNFFTQSKCLMRASEIWSLWKIWLSYSCVMKWTFWTKII